MKKFVLPIIALILVVAALLWPSDALFSTVKAGPGDGENEKIKKPEELVELLYFANSRTNADREGYTLSINGGAMPLSSLETAASKKKSDYDSFTLSENTVIKSDYTSREVVDSYYDGYDYKYIYENVASVSTSMNRALVVYMTEDESYYVSKGTYSYNYTNYRDSELSYSMYMIFDMNIYVGEDEVIFKFNNLEMAGDNIEKISRKIIGKWYSVPREGADEIFGMVDAFNRGNLSKFGSMIEYGIDEDEFDKDGKIYTMEYSTLEEDDTEFTVDLTDSENPYIEYIVDGKSEDGYSMSYVYDTVVFSNIGNTVIDVDDKNVEEFDDMEEFYEFMEDMIDE